MNKKFTTIWGVGLVLVLMVSLLVGALPASAKNLAFTPETLPSTTDLILADPAAPTYGLNLVDMSVADDGQTIYVADGTASILKSTNAGASWSAKGTGLTAVDKVAVAPDDPNLVIAADSAAGTVTVSTNGGTTWGAITPTPAFTAAAINDIAASSAYAGSNYVAVALGTGVAGGGDISLYKLGIGGTWRLIEADTGFASAALCTDVLAVEFSPNFSSDQTLLAVTLAAAAGTQLEAYSVNKNLWNEFPSYPVQLLDSTSTVVTAVTSASMALAPTYLGGDEVERVCFIGLNGGTAAGVYRIEDYTPKYIKSGANIYSVAYDGNVLVAGQVTSRVWRSNDALASSPTFYVSTATKSPSGGAAAGNPVLAYAGANVVCVTAGNESAFAVSTDSGMSFNDLSLINTALTVINDFAVAADGSVKYFASDDGADLSLWRKAGTGAWQRVLSVQAATTTSYITRVAADEPDVVYVASIIAFPAANARNLYVSKDGGVSRWYARASRYDIQDIAIESVDVAYVAVAGAGTVSKTVNAGFTWADEESAKLKAGNCYSIKSIAEDQVVVGSTGGAVSYSTDGGDSWYKIPQSYKTGPLVGTNVHVTADTLSPGGYIWAGSEGYDLVTRWAIGQPDVPWFDMLSDARVGYAIFGIEYKDGALYVNSADATFGGYIQRTLRPDVAVANNALYWGDWALGLAPAVDSVPVGAQVGNLVVTAGSFKGMPGNTIYVATGGFIRSCIDTLVTTGPTVVGPADGKEVRLNPISGGISNVSLSWNRISEATSYQVQVSYDKDFNEKLTTLPIVGGVAGNVNSSAATAAMTMGGLNLDLGTTYYWRVMADEANGADVVMTPWSETRSFSVESGGTVSPGILSPENGGYVAQTSPSFSWAPVSGATRYEFQLSADTSFAAPLASTQHAAAGASPDVTLEVDTTYYWRVRSIEPSMGEWSTIANFTVSDSVPGQSGAGDVNVTVPEIVIPEIVIPQATVNLPPQPDTTPAISEGLLWAVIIIGAVLVIALIVLIVRTRRTV